MDMSTINADAGTTDLDSLINSGAIADRKLSVLVGNNLGSNTLLSRVPLHELYEISEVANAKSISEREGASSDDISQRKLDHKHAVKLAVYVLKGVTQALVNRYAKNNHPTPATLEALQLKLGRQPYMAIQPITANIRSCAPGGKGLKFEDEGRGMVNVYLSTKDVMWIVDGQHRRVAIQMMFDYMKQLLNTKRYPKRPAVYARTDGAKVPDDEYKIWNELYEVARTQCTVMVEAHLGLNAEQERQLFHDLNNLTKKIESSLAFSFDQSNHVNLWIKEHLIDDGVLKAKVVERDVVDWRADEGVIARKDLIGVCAILFLNKTNVKSATPQAVAARSTFVQKFWESVGKIPRFGTTGAKQVTLAAQPVVLKALAKLAYDFAFGKYQDETHLRTLMAEMKSIPFGHTEPLWRYYQLTPEQRKKFGLTGLEKYLPDEGKHARDIGVFNEKDKIMRFSIRHNDVLPIIGDMIRWKLNLPPRNQ